MVNLLTILDHYAPKLASSMRNSIKYSRTRTMADQEDTSGKAVSGRIVPPRPRKMAEQENKKGKTVPRG